MTTGVTEFKVRVGVDQEVRFTQLRPTFAAQAHGFDLSRLVTDALRDAINQAMERFAVVVFPDQNLDDEELFSFGSRFGPIEGAGTTTFQDRRRLANGHLRV